jgi:hypothetical protein
MRGATYLHPHKIFNRWKNYFCQLLNVHGAGVVRQTEVRTAEPFVPDPSSSEVVVAIGKLKRYKSPGVDEISAELIKVEGEILRSEIHNLIKLIWNKEELPHQWKESIRVPIHKKGDRTDCSNYRILSTIFLAWITPYADEITGDHQCGFQCNRSTDQIFYIRQMLEKNGSILVQYISYLEISRKPTIQLGGKYYTVF